MAHIDTLNRIYRVQRHFYDATRRLFLFGRDALLNAMSLSPGDRVLELGCGTARNLIQLAKRHPEIALFGLDASSEMLATARKSIDRAGLSDRIALVEGVAEALDHQTTFGLDTPFDVIFFSYSLSMMPAWEDALAAAFRNLRSGGELFVVDFHDQSAWPKPFRAAIIKWLSLFHVQYVPDTLKVLEQSYSAHGDAMQLKTIGGRYAFMTMPARGFLTERP